jgi:hypothetical protein
MTTENYGNLYFDDEKIRLTVLTNLCRMIVTRGYMDINKYKTIDGKSGTKNIVEHPTHDHIDNDLFLPYIKDRIDSGIYIIPLDTHYKDQREGKGPGMIDFDGSSIVVKLVPQVLKDIGSSPILDDFIKTYNKQHKIIVFDGMSDKVYNVLNKKKNVEVFDRDFLMIDLMSMICAPISCNFVTHNDMSYITNPKIEKIHENDPLTRYYNGKRGNILRVVRPSINNSAESAYKRVIEPKSFF